MLRFSDNDFGFLRVKHIFILLFNILLLILILKFVIDLRIIVYIFIRWAWFRISWQIFRWGIICSLSSHIVFSPLRGRIVNFHLRIRCDEIADLSGFATSGISDVLTGVLFRNELSCFVQWWVSLYNLVIVWISMVGHPIILMFHSCWRFPERTLRLLISRLGVTFHEGLVERVAFIVLELLFLFLRFAVKSILAHSHCSSLYRG